VIKKNFHQRVDYSTSWPVQELLCRRIVQKATAFHLYSCHTPCNTRQHNDKRTKSKFERLLYRYCTMCNFCLISNNRTGVASLSTDISQAVLIRQSSQQVATTNYP